MCKDSGGPTQGMTIPRLELLSGLLLARLMHTVKESLKDEVQIVTFHYFTDSKVTYHWIRGSNKAWKPFVQNRVDEIRRLAPTDRWSHCLGRDNPADLPSRGLSQTELRSSRLWFEGPSWLRDPLPLILAGSDLNEVVLPQECLLEARATRETTALVVTEMTHLIQLERYHDLDHIL